jgi:two-component system sensor histidine kinase UhpB
VNAASVPVGAAAAGRWLQSRWAWFGLGVLYALAWTGLASISHLLWFLPAGLRLGALWATPSRRWGWLAGAEWSALAALTLAKGWPLLAPHFLAMSVLPWLVYATVVRLVRGPEPQPLVDAPQRMLLLLGAGLLSAALVSPLLQLFTAPMSEKPPGLAGVFAFLYGDFIGQLILAPLLVLMTRVDLRRLEPALWLAILLQMLFSLLLFGLIRERHDLASFLLVLAFAPVFLLAFRHGWAGAVLSVSQVGLLVQALTRLPSLPLDMQVLQLALAVVGGGGLILGAATSELRRSHERLSQRHRELAQVNRSLTQAAVELRQVSQRLVRLEEQGQRELASELDFELGRSIQALGTRISLAFRDVRDEQMLRLLESVRQEVREMQDSLRRILLQLRPPVLDTHGLREAVGFGPLRDLLEDAGIGYETSFQGHVEALNDDAKTTVYRICQAAVREASRSKAVRGLRVAVEELPGEQRRLEVEIRIDIETIAGADFPFEPVPLPAITDRVLAQQGGYWVEALATGVRHRIRFQENPPSPR